MILHWLKTFEKVDNQTLQEVSTCKDAGFIHHGRIIKFCPVCGRWVTEDSFKSWCASGYHEYAVEVTLDSEKLVEDIKE